MCYSGGLPCALALIFLHLKNVLVRQTLYIEDDRSPKPPPLPHLPTEIIERVADFLFETHPPNDLDSSILCCVKPPWRNVAGFMNASSQLRRMGYVRWAKVLVIRSPEDWSEAARYSRWIRELRCLDGSLSSPLHQRVLAGFEHLYAVSIDAHGDVSHNGQNQFAYRDLIGALPPSLRRLEITRAHGPDIRIIATVKEYCPNLEELRLGRCTIFNSPSACDFWRSFPFDHDSYMSSQDTDSYAHSLAQELLPFRSLTSLRLGLYLIPSTTVLAHRIYHRRNLPAPAVIDWQQAIPQAQLLAPIPDAPLEPAATDQLISLLHEPDPKNEFGAGYICAMCFEVVSEINGGAEASANGILKELIPSLEKIQWMSWFSPGHLGLNSYTLLPPPAMF